jgi:uncharacterized protein
MFGTPSLSKLLLLLAIILIVWYGFRLIGRLDTARREEARLGRRNRRRPAAAAPQVEETIRCPRCGAYVPARRPTGCGRADCPYPS